MSNLRIDEKKEKNQIGNVGLLIQGVLALMVLIFGIICLMEKSFMILFEILLVSELVIMAINNHVTYKKKGMTMFYIIVASLLSLSIVLELL